MKNMDADGRNRAAIRRALMAMDDKKRAALEGPVFQRVADQMPEISEMTKRLMRIHQIGRLAALEVIFCIYLLLQEEMNELE